MTRAPYFPVDHKMTKALFKTSRAEKFRDRLFMERGIEIFPGIWSTDPQMLQFKRLLASVLNKELKPSVNEWGMTTGNGVTADFHSLRHINGFGQNPATWPLASNLKLRQEKKLATDFVEDWHKTVFQALVRLFFRGIEPTKMKIRKGSSSMVPYFTTDMEEKKELVRYYHNVAASAGDLIAKGKFTEAYLNYDVGGAYAVVYRRQVDGFVDGKPKDRPVADLDYALTGGEEGRVFVSSKDPTTVDPSFPSDFSLERKRTAMGGPLGINSILMPVAQGMRNKIYDEFAYTLHHTTRASLQTDLREWKFSIAADVSQHDQYWPTFLIPYIAAELEDLGFEEWWVAIYKMKAHMPFFVSGVGQDEPNLLIGDWRNPDINMGLHSGNAFTDIEGTLLMVFCYFLMQVEHTMPQLVKRLQDPLSAEHILHDYLRGKLPIVLKDKSDDALLGWTDPTLVPKAKALLEKMKRDEQVSPYMAISYEHGGAFLGSVLLYPQSLQMSELTLIGNVSSLVNRQFNPEYGVQSQQRDRSKVKRGFPGLAWETLPTVYGDAPAYSTVMDAIEFAWQRVYGTSYRRYREVMLAEDKVNLAKFLKMEAAKNPLNGNLDYLTQIDHEVLADPSKLEYKYIDSDITPGVMDILMQGIPVEEITPFFNSIIGR